MRDIPLQPEGKKIMLVYPPDVVGSDEKKPDRVIDVFQPLGLAYIAAALEQAGYQARIIAAGAEGLSEEEIIHRAAEYKPAIVGLGVSTPDFSAARSLARRLKASYGHTVIIGGAHVSALPEETLKEECFDYGVVGEGEHTIVELVDAISKNELERLPQIKGIVFRQGERVVLNPPRERIRDLDSLPFPARHLFPSPDKYTYLYYKKLPIATVITSRGCPYQCTFCDRAVFGNEVRMRSINNILDEIQMLARDYGVRGINIPDDLFTVPPERLAEFCHGLLSRKLKVSWSCFSRVDSVTPDMLKLMKRSGCWMIGYGIESGNPRSLQQIKKDSSVEKARKALRATRNAGIRNLGFFILGLPGERESDVSNTISFANSLPLDRAVFFMTQPFPGSQLYRDLLSQGKVDQQVGYRYYHNYCFPGKLAYVTEGLNISMLREYRRLAYRSFYLRPGYILRQLANYPELRRLPLRMKAFLKAVR